MLSLRQIQEYKDQGMLVFERLFSVEQCEELRREMHNIVEAMNPEQHREIFVGGTQQLALANNYFMNSGDKIAFFWEKDAFGSNGELVYSKHESLNKVGHALHILNPAFRRFTFSDKMKNIARSLGFVAPHVTQSMYIFKNARIGGEVPSHQDATFLYNEPTKIVGFWVALEDCTATNGCMEYIPASHKDGLHNGRRMIRNPDPNSSNHVIYTAELRAYNDADFIKAIIPAGSLLVFDGCTVHRSMENRSEKSRHAYTFHMCDMDGTRWAPDNWLQPTNEVAFTPLYDTAPVA